ncbi:MAG: ribonuclease HI family protein [Syntrophales bacterium]
MHDSFVNLFTDGASRGNPGEAGAGIVLSDADGVVLGRRKKFLGVCTNNEAEYRALVIGLEEALRKKCRRLHIHLDSELIVRQILGLYKIRSGNLIRLADEVKKLLSYFDAYTIEHISREKNAIADRLANEAIDEYRT